MRRRNEPRDSRPESRADARAVSARDRTFRDPAFRDPPFRAPGPRGLGTSLALAASLTVAIAAAAPGLEPYAAPRTEHGQPDLQGTWAAEFLTLLERPPGVDRLVVGSEQAATLVEQLRALRPKVFDPDVTLLDIGRLATVRGERRTSLLVDPPDGRIPYTQAGLDLVTSVQRRWQTGFDDPEQRPLAERCLESVGYPPMRVIPTIIPQRIHQTLDHVVLVTEDPVGVRIVELDGEPPPSSIRSVQGYTRGRWEGDTLVATTTNLLAQPPARFGIGRPVLLSPETTIEERFTRVSDAEIVYRFTVFDASLYERPWTGEYSLTRFDQPMYEYACHEGNYSLPNGLRGGQAEADRRAAEGPESR